MSLRALVWGANAAPRHQCCGPSETAASNPTSPGVDADLRSGAMANRVQAGPCTAHYVLRTANLAVLNVTCVAFHSKAGHFMVTFFFPVHPVAHAVFGLLSSVFAIAAHDGQ